MVTISKVFRSDFIQGILHLFFPETCISCSSELSPSENQLCVNCSSNLTRTDFERFNEPTVMDQLFWGRVDVQSTYAFLFFKKQASSQRVLFSLKYKNATVLGDYFGKQIGERLHSMPSFSTVDVIVPVPLHPKKEFLRGYNQSLFLAQGIAETFERKLAPKLVRRIRHNETQTKKNRFQRWDNVQGLFSVQNSIQKFDHVMLVDDVITTGSTIEVIIRAIREVHPHMKVSVVTLAIT